MTYYDLAINDLRYLEYTLPTIYYNNIANGAKKVVKELLKSVAELYNFSTELFDVMDSDDNMFIAKAVMWSLDIRLDIDKIKRLDELNSGIYNPGPDYHELSYEECCEAISILYYVLDTVNAFRSNMGLNTIDTRLDALQLMLSVKCPWDRSHIKLIF
jgi:hypothetical protein